MSDLRLSDRWWGLDDTSARAEARRDAVMRELATEMGTGHELSGSVVRVEAFFEASDDVIVRLVDNTYALVHPTWSMKTERLSHPTTQQLGNAADASEAVARWELFW